LQTWIKELENTEIVQRVVVDNRPPRVIYSLTEKGKTLSELLNKLEKEYIG
jgi:DNA-binding HxlR family transcriptional regulator